MPCICYGAVSGDEELDRFLKTPEGVDAMQCLLIAAALIKKHRVCAECFYQDFEKSFVKCFEHLLLGCPEKEVK